VLASGADALLRGSGPVVVAVFEAEEDVLELVHAGVGEEQSGVVVGDERGGVDTAVSFALKELQEGLTDFGAGHVSHRLIQFT